MTPPASTLDIPALEAAAKAATPGPWRDSAEQRSPGWRIVSSGTPDGPGSTVAQWCLPADALHIATAHPAAVLALIAEVRALRAGLVEACDLHYTTPEQRAAGFDPEGRLAALRAQGRP